MIYKISPTSLNLMKECPRCFWLTLHKIWKRPRGIFPTLSNGMDHLLKEYFDSYRDTGTVPSEIGNDCNGMRLLGINEKEKFLLKEWKNNFKGIFWIKDGNILNGAIDEILVNQGKLIVLDFKTRGFQLKENTIEFYRLSLDVYNFLIRKKGYETEDFSYLLFYIPIKVLGTGEIAFSTELIKVESHPENVEELFENSIKLLNGPCPEEGCEWCKHISQ